MAARHAAVASRSTHVAFKDQNHGREKMFSSSQSFKVVGAVIATCAVIEEMKNDLNVAVSSLRGLAYALGARRTRTIMFSEEAAAFRLKEAAKLIPHGDCLGRCLAPNYP